MSDQTRAAVTTTRPAPVPDGFPGHREHAPLDLPPLTPRLEEQLCDLLVSRDFDAWSEALARVGNCAHPVKLHGHSQRIDTRTGEILSSYSSAFEPLGVTHGWCGNRRASVCPSCSRRYAADTFHLIRAGVAGGKTVPETVADNPLVFATLTAPSFGHVHGHRNGRACRPRIRGPRRCEHGRPTTCGVRHDQEDALLGQPLCGDCYDYASHLVWQWWVPQLWKRFTIGLRRLVAKTLGIPATRLDEIATVQYAKVAEYQLRGLVHFHALIRLDGPKTPDGFAPAPASLDAAVLADLVRQAAAGVRLTVPGVDADDPARTLAFGAQLDTRPVRLSRRTDDPDRTLTPGQVAGYLAKYATKSATDTGDSDSPHHRRIRGTARHLADRAAAQDGVPAAEAPYAKLGDWVHMLGFRGHFGTKSRRYSITLTALRRARQRAQALIAQHRAEGRPLDLAALETDLLADEQEETTLVLGHWTYVGTGWNTDAQTVLANAAAARAREHDQWKAQRRRERTA
ncbi:plasmid replication initiator protein [Nocardioides koreensis]|uniref:Plasmid replication initiator protein n=1 Tax=Nocardioides koreensis TaxID=433651 RepID=A0ABP5LX91_9ACTN